MDGSGHYEFAISLTNISIQLVVVHACVFKSCLAATRWYVDRNAFFSEFGFDNVLFFVRLKTCEEMFVFSSIYKVL